MEMDKETVQVVAIAAGTTIAVAALVFDGELGYAMGTGILTLAGTISGYWWGVSSCKSQGGVVVADEEEDS